VSSHRQAIGDGLIYPSPFYSYLFLTFQFQSTNQQVGLSLKPVEKAPFTQINDTVKAKDSGQLSTNLEYSINFGKHHFEESYKC
jgi:hypothetical protein